MFPDISGELASAPAPGVFLSCSADNTIRLWCMDDWTHPQNILSAVSLALNVLQIKQDLDILEVSSLICNCCAGPPGYNLHRWEHQCPARSRMCNQRERRQTRRRTDGREQDGHQEHLCESGRPTPGIWRPQRNAEVGLKVKTLC